MSVCRRGGGVLLAKMDVDADLVDLYTCHTTATGCSGVAVIDLRRLKLQSASASLCLEGDDIGNASGMAIRTNRGTASNTCL